MSLKSIIVILSTEHPSLPLTGKTWASFFDMRFLDDGFVHWVDEVDLEILRGEIS
ncbi:hypothetical protein ACFL17_10585 [Pseudomonadota bacterium]